MGSPKWVRQLTPTQADSVMRNLKLTPAQQADKGLMQALRLTVESTGHANPQHLGRMVRRTLIEHQKRQTSMQHNATNALNPNHPLAQTLARLFAMIQSALLLELADESEEHKSDDLVEEQNEDVANIHHSLALQFMPLMAAELDKLDDEQLQTLNRELGQTLTHNMTPRPEPKPEGLKEYVETMAQQMELNPEASTAPTPFNMRPKPGA